MFLKHKKLSFFISIISALLIIIIILGVFLNLQQRSESETEKPLSRFVMHASGGLDNKKYLNSKESFEHHIKKGERLFEIDFAYTADKKIVCTHEFENIGNFSFEHPPTYAEFNSAKILGEYTPLSVDYLVSAVKKNPNIVIVFDTKHNNKVELFNELYTTLRNKGFNTSKNLITQVYNYNDYKILKDLEVREFWFTNYVAIYPQDLINIYFSNEEKVTTIVLSYNVYSRFLNEDFKLTKDIAIHGTSQELTKENSTNLDVRYIFVHY